MRPVASADGRPSLVYPRARRDIEDFIPNGASGSYRITVAVGMTIADRPPRGSVRARLRIRLLPWMNGGGTCCWPHTVQSLGRALPALCRTHV